MKNNKNLKRIFWVFALAIVLLNVIAFFHAYKFTHFASAGIAKAPKVKDMSFGYKIKALLFGIDIPRPVNHTTPSRAFETINLQSNKMLECWSVKADSAKGTVILFHGYTGNKASMLDKATEFLNMGYNVFLPDFMGSGGSEGDQTTVGFKEAEQVNTCYNYVVKRGDKNVYLFGTSMGAAAILKAVNDYHVTPAGIIIECPFGTMYQTTCARFKNMGLPSFPMAGVLLFWGGMQNNFWPFAHNPAEYAKAVRCPTLLIYGAKDDRVSMEETNTIFTNIQGSKQLKIYPLAGHDNYLKQYKADWVKDIDTFINSNK